MRTSLEQPFELTAIWLGPGGTGSGRATGVFIQQEDHMLRTVAQMNQIKKGTELNRPLAVAY
jgi:hypothetical protein